jgi:hypothetical protein
MLLSYRVADLGVIRAAAGEKGAYRSKPSPVSTGCVPSGPETPQADSNKSMKKPTRALSIHTRTQHTTTVRGADPSFA